MNEQQLQDAVIDLARLRGCMVYHTYDSRRSAPGFPDLVIAGHKGILFAELKSDGGRLSVEQQQWKWRLLASGQAWRLWRPADLLNGEIKTNLALIAGPPVTTRGPVSAQVAPAGSEWLPSR